MHSITGGFHPQIYVGDNDEKEDDEAWEALSLEEDEDAFESDFVIQE
jgi:hypothetical protein